jgi:elongation factor Ts
MSEITAAMVKELRDLTGAGMMDCKKALAETGGDLERARDRLREQGIAKAAGRASRSTDEGVIEAYVHAVGGGLPKLGVLVEVNCETDFVAKTDDFKQLARELALQVAGASPEYVRPEDIPAARLMREMSIFRAQAEGKPEAVVEKILAGKVAAFYSDVCLLEQPWIRDEKHKKKVKDLVQETAARVKENISVGRFVRFQVGEKSAEEAGEEG